MGKNAKKSEVRGQAAGSTITTKQKQKFIKKKTTVVQAKAVNDTVTKGLQGISLFEQLNDTNEKGQNKLLMALSAVSLTEGMPLEMFYEPNMIGRVMELANQLQHNLNLTALDAIRNLYIQAHLINRPDCAKIILDKGLFQMLEQIIGKAINQLQFDKSHSSDVNTREQGRKSEDYRLVIEQAFICLSDICHFVEHGQTLQELTQSQLVIKSVQLVQNCRDFGEILNVRIFRQVSLFLKELSNDNEYIKSLDLSQFNPIVEDSSILPINAENIDFFWNLLEFHFNVVTEKEGQVGVFTRLNFYVEKITGLLGSPDRASAQQSDPATFFKANFLSKYKLADMFVQNQAKVSEEEVKQGQAAAGDSDEEEMQEADEEDKVANTEPQFRTWYANLLAQTNCMKMLLKIADYLDSSKVRNDTMGDDEDEDFEDCEEDDDDGAMEDTNANPAQVIDLDEQKQNCLRTVFGFLDHILLRSQPIPQLIGLQRQVGDAFDELQETAFAVLTSLLFSEMPQVKQAIGERTNDILQALMNFIQLATYKCERPSSENAAECLSALACCDESARKAIFAHANFPKAAQYAAYMPNSASMAKLYMIQTFQKVLATADQSVPETLVCQDVSTVTEVTRLLLDSCSSGDLVLICAALDAFYDIFSEEFYNQVLLESNVIQLMAQGAPSLQQLYQKSKSKKLLGRNELQSAENALENLAPFIEYKKTAMNLSF